MDLQLLRQSFVYFISEKPAAGALGLEMRPSFAELLTQGLQALDCAPFEFASRLNHSQFALNRWMAGEVTPVSSVQVRAITMLLEELDRQTTPVSAESFFKQGDEETEIEGQKWTRGHYARIYWSTVDGARLAVMGYSPRRPSDALAEAVEKLRKHGF